MRLYYCRYRDSEDTYLAHLSLTGRGLVATRNLDEVRFSTSREDMEETAAMYPQLEVCCLDSTPVCISSAVVADNLKVPGVEDVEIALAVAKFNSALKDLERIRPAQFVDVASGGLCMEYDHTSYDEVDDGICLYLRRAKSRGRNLEGRASRMDLFGKG